MGARELGAMCEAERQRRGWSLARMAYEIGLVPPDDRALNESQAKRILEGRRGLDEWMVQRLIKVFQLDPAEAWVAAGLLPHGFKAEHFRKLAFFTGQRSVVSRGYVARPAQLAPVTNLPVDPDLDRWVEPLRPRDERRSLQRRKRDRGGLWLVPQLDREKVPA